MEMLFKDRRPYNQEAFDRVYGAHSNIPLCCIDFWVADFPVIFENSVRLDSYDRLRRQTERRIKRTYHYRPCFVCLKAGYWQELHVCRDACADLAERLRDAYAYKEAV